jgi:hypothetical protein
LLKRPVKTALSILLLTVVLTGCKTKATAQREADRKAFIATQQSAMAGLEQQQQQQQQQPVVWFRGEVRNPRVPWTEGLTLAQALLAAQYTSNWDPHIITVTRQGEVHPVNPRRLLRGQEDPLLEPGDVVEVHR